MFMFYLYNRFAGYTNIVRGVSGLFGIELSRNFAYPFFSQDFSDFWRRWHISLSSWLRDYIYMPLSRTILRRNPSRSNKANLILPPLATMLASGVWHGGSLSILVWGAVNGVYIVLENLLMLFRSITPGVKRPWWRRISSSVFVVGLMLLAMIPFFMDLPTSKVFLYRLVYGWDWGIPDFRPLVIVVLSLLLDWIQYRHNDEFVFLKWPNWARSISAATAVFIILVVYNLQGAPEMFVYP
jgi:D-alanyl-lipoteichoic acid acyltransferase DltB (MBOAT superfamily)